MPNLVLDQRISSDMEWLKSKLPEPRFVSSLVITFNTIQVAAILELMRWKFGGWGCLLPSFGLEN